MNLSGHSVQSATHFYKIKPEDILVLHDEIDLPFGDIKLKQ
jgi:PTH1 family peptidyl-tRNA hydrolase